MRPQRSLQVDGSDRTDDGEVPTNGAGPSLLPVGRLEPLPTSRRPIERSRAFASSAAAADGTGIYYEVFTPERQPDRDLAPVRAYPVLLVMGLGANGRLWASAVTRLLRSGYDVVAVDNRGCGRSETPWRPWTTRTMAADAVAVLDDLEIDRAHVQGASLGGMIAQEIALEFPERAESLVLASTTGGVPGGLARLDLIPRRGLPQLLHGVARSVRRPGQPAEQVRDFLRMAESGEFAAQCQPGDEAWEAVVDMLEDPASPRGTVLQLLAAVRHSSWSRLPRLSLPVQVHHGTEDRLMPFAAGQELARRIPGVRFVVHDGAGHGIFDRPDEIANRILEFLADVECHSVRPGAAA